MRLYLIEIKNENYGYDEYDAMVVRAHNAAQARELAAKKVDGQRTEPSHHGKQFRDPNQSTCRQVKEEGMAVVVLASFNAG